MAGHITLGIDHVQRKTGLSLETTEKSIAQGM